MKQPDTEMRTAPLAESALQQALDTLHEQGFVILPEVLPEAWVTATRAAFTAELQAGYRDLDPTVSLVTTMRCAAYLRQ